MASMENHQDDPKLDDLAFTLEELKRAPASATTRPGSTWSSPPSYPGGEAHEMRNMSQHTPTHLEQRPDETKTFSSQPFNFSFFKPKRDARIKYLVALVVLLIIALVCLASIFGVLVSQEARQVSSPQNTTISITQSTTLTSTQISTIPTTTVQSNTTTQISTATSLLPNPTSVSKCWDLLQNICANTTKVPSDTNSGAFRDCKNVMAFFYCGVIQKLEAERELILPADDSPICFGMRDFCGGITIGNPNPVSLSKSAPASTTSGLRVVPVTERGENTALEATGVSVMQLLLVETSAGDEDDARTMSTNIRRISVVVFLAAVFLAVW